MRDLDVFRVGQEMIVDPSSEDRCLHGNDSRLRKRSYPCVEFQPARSDFALAMDLAAGIFDAITDRLLVNVEPDVIHMSVEEPPWL